MKKCQICGYNNTDIMNFCLECGNSLAEEPQMVVPLETVDFSHAAKSSEQVTENYEKETVVNSRFAIQPNSPTFQNSQPTPNHSNTKLFLAIGGGLLAIVMLIVVGAAGVLIYTLQNQEQKPPSRPIVSKTPINDDDDIPSTPYPEDDDDFPEVVKTPKPTPIVKKTPDKTEEPITFPTPTVATKRGKYKVRPVTGWQVSNVKTIPSQNFRVQARGRIRLDGIKKRVGVKGINGHNNRRIFKQFKTGALLMRTHYPDGRHSNIQPVGSGEYWINAPDETGKIEFFINDNSPRANSGSFSVTVTDLGVQKNQ